MFRELEVPFVPTVFAMFIGSVLLLAPLSSLLNDLSYVPSDRPEAAYWLPPDGERTDNPRSPIR